MRLIIDDQPHVLGLETVVRANGTLMEAVFGAGMLMNQK